MIFPILVHFLINITYKFSQACPGGLPERAPCVWHREEGMLVVRSVPRPWVFLDWQQWPSVYLQVINCYRTGLCFSILLSSVSSCLIFLFIIYSFLFFFSCFGNVSVLMGWSLWCTHLGQVPPSCWYVGSSTGCFNFNVFVSCWKGSSSLLTRLLFTIFLLFLEVLS